MIFKLIFIKFFLFKITKKGVFYFHKPNADVAGGTTARMRCGSEATWQGRRWPTRSTGGAQGADTWQEATRVHVDARVGRHVAMGGGVGIWRAHGLVGPG